MEPKKKNQLNILDRPLNPKGRGDVRLVVGALGLFLLTTAFVQVSLSAFSFLFAEIIQYSHRKVTSIKDLERRCVEEKQIFIFLCFPRESIVELDCSFASFPSDWMILVSFV